MVLVRESPPQLPAFVIRAKRYRKLGITHFELNLVLRDEVLFRGGRDFEEAVEQAFDTRGEPTFEPLQGGQTFVQQQGGRAFSPQALSGCEPHPYAIVYGLLKAPHDTVLARVAGELVPLTRRRNPHAPARRRRARLRSLLAAAE